MREFFTKTSFVNIFISNKLPVFIETEFFKIYSLIEDFKNPERRDKRKMK
jgi:hypothetical protein